MSWPSQGHLKGFEFFCKMLPIAVFAAIEGKIYWRNSTHERKV